VPRTISSKALKPNTDLALIEQKGQPGVARRIVVVLANKALL